MYNRAMSKSFFALALALSLLPAAALAQDANAPSNPRTPSASRCIKCSSSSASRSGNSTTNCALQILSVLTPAHRRTLAAEIGNLVLSPNPDVDAAAKQIDATLSPAERREFCKRTQRTLRRRASFASR